MYDANETTENRGGDRHPTDRENETEWLSKKGGVRCKRIKKSGQRCNKWAQVGYEYCRHHGGAKACKMSLYHFDDEETEKSFLRFRNAENYLSIQDELGIIRFCMEQLLKHYTEAAKEKGKGTLGPEALLVISDMSKNVASVAKDCNTIERGLSVHISIDTLEMWLSQICETFSECGASDEMVADFIEKVGKLRLPTGGRKSLRDLAEEDDEQEARQQMTDKQLYDEDDDEGETEVSLPISKPTVAPDAQAENKKKRTKKKDKPRNERDDPRGKARRKIKRRKQ